MCGWNKAIGKIREVWRQAPRNMMMVSGECGALVEVVEVVEVKDIINY